LTGTGADDLLSPDEVQRGERLKLARKANAFKLSRTRLRQILGGYLAVAPAEVAFSYSEYGKPYLSGNPLHFNLSHSGEWGLCAVTRIGVIGVDLETVDPALDFAALARRFLSAAENRWLFALPRSRQRRAFFRLWTRKEAWLKGQGGGFSESELGLVPEHIAATAAMAGGWWLMNLPIKRGVVGALAVSGPLERLTRLSFSG
jgi:4'-phosphopantetheinyl transferase